MVEKTRFTAYKVKIDDIIRGKYVKSENGSTIVSKYGQPLGRVRVYVTIVDKFISDDKKFSSITLDDGTNTIRAKMFKSLLLESFNIGDNVDLIGKVKEYNEEIYIIPETIMKVADPNYEILRELEITEIRKILERKKQLVKTYQKQAADLDELKQFMREYGIKPEEVEAIIESESIEDFADDQTQTKEHKEKVLVFIAQLDKGDGCDYSELVQVAGLDEPIIESIIEELLEEGVCFEPRPGKIKCI